MNTSTMESTEKLPVQVREDFPILSTTMNGKPLVYLDNGATTQKPRSVIRAICNYYERDNANIHRGLYELSQRATDGYETARRKVAQFIHASSTKECIFVRGTTEAINLIASSWGRMSLGPDDEIIVSGLEHHSNIVPWQMACADSGAKLRVWHGDEHGVLPLERLKELLSPRTKMLAMQHVSNALGTVHKVREACQLAKSVGATVLIDGAQWVGHHATNVQEIGCDFYTFSGHKLFGPTGIGVLWGHEEILETMPPYQGGGDMIETVSFQKTTYADLPNRFEAGTPNIAGAIGLGAAIDYVSNIGFARIEQQEELLLEVASAKLSQIPGLRIIGDGTRKAAVVSFVLEKPNIAPLDVANHLANAGIAIRTGHHCCMPLMGELHVSGTSRASFSFYNTIEEVEALSDCLNELVRSRSASASRELPSSDIEFAKAKADSIEAAAEELAEEFLDFDDPESKTELLMEIGQTVPAHFDALKEISEAVPGCMSEVYLVGRPDPDHPDRFQFAADSNAAIVRGLIGVLQHLFSGQPAEQILHYKLEDFFRKIGLDQFVSTQRRSGLAGMVARIRALARSIVEREEDAS